MYIQCKNRNMKVTAAKSITFERMEQYIRDNEKELNDITGCKLEHALELVKKIEEGENMRRKEKAAECQRECSKRYQKKIYVTTGTKKLCIHPIKLFYKHQFVQTFDTLVSLRKFISENYGYDLTNNHIKLITAPFVSKSSRERAYNKYNIILERE